MLHSEQIDKIATALAKAQGEIQAAVKGSENPHFKSKYADLAACWDACRAPLTANGIAVIQSPSNEDGVIHLTTMLAHASGQWMKSDVSVRAAKPDAHGLGSAITYLRRFSLCSMAGIAPGDDDDGNAASGNQDGVKSRGSDARAEPKLKAEDVTVAENFWAGDTYKVTGKNAAEFIARLQAHVSAAPGLEFVNKAMDDNKESLERVRAANKDAYDHINTIANNRRGYFLQEPPADTTTGEIKP